MNLFSDADGGDGRQAAVPCVSCGGHSVPAVVDTSSAAAAESNVSEETLSLTLQCHFKYY